MNFEVFHNLPNVDTVSDQMEAIRGAQDISDVSEYLGSHFYDLTSNSWVGSFSEYASSSEIPDAQYYKLVLLSLNQAAQFGFPSMAGHLDHAKKYQWRRSPFDPRHQLALAAEVAKINQKIAPVKEEMSGDLLTHSLEAAAGVWGFLFPPKKGDVTGFYDPASEREYYLKCGEDRLLARRRVSLPNYALNTVLSEVVFSGKDAERMSDYEFFEDVLPEVSETISDIIAPHIIFQRGT